MYDNVIMCMKIDICTYDMCICVRICKYIYANRYINMEMYQWPLYVYICICIFIYIYIYIYIYIPAASPAATPAA